MIVKYSGHTVNLHHEYPPLLTMIQKKVEAKLGEVFNHVMLNRYDNGKEYIGKHRDTKENKVRLSQTSANSTSKLPWCPGHCELEFRG